MLRITEEKFNELYPDLVGKFNFFNDLVPKSITKEQFERQYLKSKLWRLNNLYRIVNKDGKLCTFNMNLAQHKVYARSRQHPRQVILKSRQQGISTFWLVSYFDDCIVAPYLNIGLMAQGTDEASTLLERTKLLWDHLDPSIKRFFNVALVKDNAKAFELTNKSSIFIRVSFRSTTLQRLHVSEFGKIANAYPKRAKEVRTGTLQALARGNTGVIESTAEGRNDFKKLWDDSLVTYHSGQMSPKDFYPTFLSWLDDPDCVLDVEQAVDEEAAEYFAKIEKSEGITLTKEQKNFWVVQRRELSGDIFQEYPATPEEAFTASRDGTYYSKLFTEHVVRAGKVKPGLYDPNLPTDVYFDLGVDDYTVMAYVQWYRKEWRIIGEYWNNGYALAHYLDLVKECPYNVRALRFPHDIRVREQGNSKSDGTAKSRLEVVEEYKKKNELRWQLDVIAKSGVENGIEAVRRVIPHMQVDSSCTYIIDCFLNYSKEWDDKLQVWKKTPLHDEYSHGADVLRQIASSTIESDAYHKSSHERYSRSSGGGFAV